MNRSGTIAQPNQYEGGGTKTVSMFSKLVSQGSSFVMEGVKNLVVKRHVRSLSIYLSNSTKTKTRTEKTRKYSVQCVNNAINCLFSYN